MKTAAKAAGAFFLPRLKPGAPKLPCDLPWEEEWIDVLERSNYDECDLPNLLPLSELAEYRLANAAHVIGYALTQGVPFPLPPLEDADPTELSLGELDYKEAASILKGWCKLLKPKAKLPPLTGLTETEQEEVLLRLEELVNESLPKPYQCWMRLDIEVTDEPVEVRLEWTVGDWKRPIP